jgi:hypothetical protein
MTRMRSCQACYGTAPALDADLHVQQVAHKLCKQRLLPAFHAHAKLRGPAYLNGVSSPHTGCTLLVVCLHGEVLLLGSP